MTYYRVDLYLEVEDNNDVAEAEIAQQIHNQLTYYDGPHCVVQPTYCRIVEVNEPEPTEHAEADIPYDNVYIRRLPDGTLQTP